MMNLLQTAYNIADTFWLGQLSDVALPAITFAFPLVFFLISLGIGLITFTFAYPIAAVFTKSPEVAAVAAKFLRYVSSSFRFIGILRAYTGSFRGTGATISAAIISLGALGAIKLPIA